MSVSCPMKICRFEDAEAEAKYTDNMWKLLGKRVNNVPRLLRLMKSCDAVIAGSAATWCVSPWKGEFDGDIDV